MVGHTRTTKCCRTCEYFDGGGEAAKLTALNGNCLNRASDRFTPEWDHVCRQWMAESEDSDD